MNRAPVAGTIVAAHGRHYRVQFASGESLDCFTRGKRSEVACGDRVSVLRVAADQGVIEGILPRSSLFYRSDAAREKLIAANVSQIVVVVATTPSFSDEVLMRCLIAADAQGLPALVVLNKFDIVACRAASESRIADLERLGHTVLRLSAIEDASPLRTRLAGHVSVLVGQSGMGKSTIVNALVLNANAATREISKALDSGRHTTTRATLYDLDADTALIDSPGLQEFGLAHLDRAAVEHAFADLRPWSGKCRFRDCRHETEPDCAMRSGVSHGLISEARLALYRTIARSLPK